MKISSIVRINSDSFNSKGVSFINYLDTGNITENKIDNIQLIDIKSEKIPSRAKRKVKINSIIYSTVRPNQKHFGIIKKIPENFVVSTGFAVIDCLENIVNPDYLYYFLTQNYITERLHAIAEQSVSTYPSIKASDIGDIELNLPPLDIQKRISTLLSNIDEKIKLNNDINDNLYC